MYNSTFFFQYHFNYFKFEFIAKPHHLKLRKSQNIEGKLEALGVWYCGKI